ncbi:MAG TPA: STT3 domain-containing protein [Stellaceae bacterium]|nr:STT3 domain-containing protein [Stellaceae bacterium]
MAACIVLRLIPFELPAAHGLAARLIHAKAAADLLQSDPAAARLGPGEFEAAVAEWRARQADTLAPLQQQAEQRFRDAFTFVGEDGARHVYLGGEDGYYWLQLTSTMLARGTVCDRVEGGTCIDGLGNAPLGQPIEYTASPHVYLMAALQRLLTWLRPGFPLTTTATLLPLLLSVVAVIPTFLIAERVSGRLGGLTAALLLSLNALVFVRGSYSDDDIWIVVLPVCAMGFITAAFGRATWRTRCLLAGLGGVMLAVLAVAWKGWPLFALYSAAGLIALGAWAALAALVAKLRGRPSDLGLLRTVCLCALSIIVGFVTAGWLVGVRVDPGVFAGGLSSVIGGGGSAPARINTAPLSYVFHMVAELASVNAETVQRWSGPVATGLGLVGFSLALLIPSNRRQSIRALGLLVLGPSIAALLAHYSGSRTPMLLVPALTGLAAGIGAWFLDKPVSDRAAATGILGLAWLGATLWMSFEGERYILLSMAPLSVSAGIAVGRAASTVKALVPGERPLARAAPVIAAGALAALALGPVASLGWAQALALAPSINGTWTGAFSTIRAQSGSDAIVDIWWDYGHWAKYYTGRAVATDGASLLSQSVHWMARALAAPSDTEALGWLRMMNCGAVADPDGGRPARPYEMLNRWSADPGLAFRSMIELSRLPRGPAADFLRGAGLPEPRLAALLATAYCKPPASFLVLTTGLFNENGWLESGLWDPGRAYVVELAQHGSFEAALPAMQTKFGLSEAMARDYYAAAKRVRTEDDRIAFAAPGAQVWSRTWQACVAEDDGLHCALNLGNPRAGASARDLTVDPEHPERTRIRLVPSTGAAAVEVIPAVVEIARPDRLEDVSLADATAGLAVLVDPEHQRVFVGTPGVVHSTVVRLALLDGRYSSPFQKIYDQSAVDGQRITVWRVIWGQS